MNLLVGLLIFVVVMGVLGGILSVVMQSRSNKRFEESVENQGFRVTKKYSYSNGVLLIDENNKKWAVNNTLFKSKIYDFKDLLDVEIFEDGVNIGKTSSLDKAVVGGLLFGVAGAVIGGSMGKRKNECTSLGIRIIVNDLNNPFIQLNFINTKTKIGSFAYKTALQSANQIASALTVIQYSSNITNKSDNDKN